MVHVVVEDGEPQLNDGPEVRWKSTNVICGAAGTPEGSVSVQETFVALPGPKFVTVML